MKNKIIVLLFLVMIPFIVLVYLYGDVDGNNTINNKDYELVKSHILKNPVLTGELYDRADVNNDNKIDFLDYVLIRKTILNNNNIKETINVNSISLDNRNIVLVKGKTTTLGTIIMPSNATNKDVTWTSSNNSVASVDNNGKVTALKEGTATITVTTKDGNKKATCVVNVKNDTGNYSDVYFLNVYDTPSILKTLANTDNKKGYECGQAIIIKSIDEKYILIDTGIKNDEVLNTIYNRLKKEQKSNKVVIDYMIISHSHYDHIGNAVGLIESNNITVKKVIMKKEIKSPSAYNNILKALNNKDDMVKITSEGQKINVGNFLEIYLFNTSDVYKGKECHEKGYHYDYTSKPQSATPINGKYYYFDGSLYPNIKIIETTKKVMKNDKIVKGMNNYFYAIRSASTSNDCNANTNSLAVVIKVKTKSGNRYMYFPGDLDNSGYDIVPINGYYGNSLEITYPTESKIKISNNNGLFTGYVDNLNRIPGETNTAKSIKNKLGSDIKNIMIYQVAHHGLNNAPDAINLLGLNRSSLYAVVPHRIDISDKREFTFTRTYYYTLFKAKKLTVGGSSTNGVYCSVNSNGNTQCKNY